MAIPLSPILQLSTLVRLSPIGFIPMGTGFGKMTYRHRQEAELSLSVYLLNFPKFGVIYPYLYLSQSAIAV